MSSWTISQVQHSKQKGNYYQTTEAGFCSIFLNLFYTFLYAKQKKIKLLIFDKPNPIGVNYSFFKPILQLNNKEAEYINNLSNTIFPIKRQDIIPNLTRYSDSILRNEAIQFFNWTDNFKEKILSRKLFSIKFDIGIHIRAGDKITTGEMKKISIDQYIEKARGISTTENPNIFLMSDTYSLIQEFKEKAPSTWIIYSFPSTILSSHIQYDFNRKSQDEKLDAFIQFMAELYTLKECKKIICTFSSNISRFLYLIHHNCEYYSLDLPSFSAF